MENSMKYSNKELHFIIERIDKNTYELNEWELKFFNSIKAKVLADIPISNKQHEKLSQIWDKLQGV